MRTNEQEPKPIHRNCSKLLISESPLQVLPTLAVKIGLNEALMLQQVHYWISNPMNKNIRDGRIWVYKTFEEWKAEFPFWCLRTIKSVIAKLEEMGLLISSSKFNRSWANRTKWYSIDYNKLDELELTENRPITISSVSNTDHSAKVALSDNASPALCHSAKVALSLTEITTEITTENNNNDKHKVIELPKKKKRLHVEPKPVVRQKSEPEPKAEPTLEAHGPNGSVVVNCEIDDLMKLVVGWAISRVMLETWAKKHGVAYVLQKIELTKSAIGLNRVRKPGAYLNKAIELDWLPPAPDEDEEAKNKPVEPTFPTHEENVGWYDKLDENEKLAVLSEAVRKNPYLEEHLKNANTSVLDTGFSNSPWFKMMMSNVGRAV